MMQPEMPLPCTNLAKASPRPRNPTVTVDPLGGRMHDDVGSVLDRPDQIAAFK